ncbi:AMP-binding protein [Marinomonas mediterranea]|uniref:Long-chain-fatty-acid--CoA ligase n=1 Tax=Marinomonas mediterranea (strain ATCC 700492 / JCM 21426 / NBRC 103028 / MMB-1) TaxID=717774 RepID=F2K0N5_MARM1|nr:AMP-binding protein [Marinomonas mediterranea]ADZ92127.1 Long-chain-fatty-acid--CoA ligase [Marinomonas mediterranea MMB-1]WCN18192.1 AMP-binding protein [Marinomonas mediterranea MMB-1]
MPNEHAVTACFEPGLAVPVSLNPQNFQTILEVLTSSCEKFKDLPAFSCMGRTLTYRELNEKSDQFAGYIQNHTDLQVGDRIAIQLPNVLQYPVVVFGALKAGLVIVNTNPLYTPKELEHQFNDSGVKALVVLANMAHTVEKIVHKTGIKHLIITELADFHPPVKRVLINSVVRYIKKMVPDYSLPEAKRLNDVLALGKGLPLRKVKGEQKDIVALQYTGGTTGVAKGAMLTNANLISNMHQLSFRLKEHLKEQEELFIAPLPLYHIYAFLIHGLTLFERGGHTVLIPNPRDLPNFVKELNKWKFTGFVGLNTLFVGLCNRDDFKAVDFSNLKITCSGGMPLTHAAADQWKELTGCQVVEGYGLTETSPVVSFNPIGYEKVGTIGLPVDETKVKVIDEEGLESPQGEPGVLCVSGPQVMKGYWQQEEATRDVMTKDGFLITGDIAVIHDDGYLQIVDRAKDMIIVSGFNVYPTEIEDVLCSHPDVLEAAAIGVEDDKTGEAVKAFIVLRNAEKEPSTGDIRAYCKEHLTPYKVPKFVEVRKELPKTNVGKVLRRALREEDQSA